MSSKERNGSQKNPKSVKKYEKLDTKFGVVKIMENESCNRMLLIDFFSLIAAAVILLTFPADYLINILTAGFYIVLFAALAIGFHLLDKGRTIVDYALGTVLFTISLPGLVMISPELFPEQFASTGLFLDIPFPLQLIASSLLSTAFILEKKKLFTIKLFCF